jgi:hypothetical protein
MVQPGNFKRNRFGHGELLVCLLLALLCLYNPYLRATNGSAGFGFCHAASYRATVGASELEQFSPTNSRDFLSTPLLATLETLLYPVALSAGPQWQTSPVTRVPALRLSLPPSLCFRPPPTL